MSVTTYGAFRTRGRLGPVARGLLLALALGAAGCDSAEERLAKHYARGVELLEAEQFEKAALEFRNALKLDENHAPARLEIAKLYERDREFSAAVGNYRLVAELDPANLESRLKLGQILLLGGALDEAATYAGQAVALAPEDPDALVLRASVSYRLENRDSALADARKALELRPDHVGGNVLLVTGMVDAGDTTAALARLDALLADNPAERTFNLIKLRLLSQRDDAAATEAHLRRLTTIYPGEVAFHRAIAQMRLAAGDLDGAEAELRSVAAADPDNAEAALDVVRLIGRARGGDAARAELEALVAAAGADTARAAPFEMALVEIDYRDGARDAARARLERLIAADDGAAARLQLARIEIAEKNPDAARALVEAVLAADADNVAALNLRAGLLIDAEDPEAAIRDVRRALDLDPQNVQLMLTAARAYERAGSPDLQGERLSAATRASNYAPEIAASYATFLRGRDQAKAAETVLAESARLNPGNRALLGALAELRLQLKDWVGADEVAARLRALDGGAAAADQVAAASLGAQGRFGESIDVLQKLAEDPQNNQVALAGLVAAYVRSGEIDRAETFIDGVLADNPANLRALLLRAELHLLRGQTAEAAARLRAVIAAAPNNPVGYVTLARFETRQGQPEAAEKTVRAGLAAVADNPVLRLMLAERLEQRRAYDEAIDVYRGLYESNPDSAVFANNFASLLAEHKADDPESLAFAARVAQRLRASEVPQFQDTYGWTLFLNGDAAGALRSLIPAAEKLPTNPLVRYHLGRAHAALGRTEDARAEFNAALTVDPGFPKADEARAALSALPPAPGVAQ